MPRSRESELLDWLNSLTVNLTKIVTFDWYKSPYYELQIYTLFGAQYSDELHTYTEVSADDYGLHTYTRCLTPMTKSFNQPTKL